MGDSDYYADGDWNFFCDLCGKKAKASTGVKTWDGHWVCRSHKEIRNPQDFIRGVRENLSVPWERPEAPDTFVGINYTRTFTDPVRLTEASNKGLQINFGLGKYTDSSINGQLINEYALNSNGASYITPEDIILSETHFANNNLPFTEPVAVGLETLTFYLGSPTALNGAAINKLLLG